jgi:hypothetical protein
MSVFVKPRQLHYATRSHVSHTQMLTTVHSAVIFTSVWLRRSNSVRYLVLTAADTADISRLHYQ